MISPVRVWDKETRTREAHIMATTEGMMYHENWNKDSGSLTYDTTRAQIYRCVHCNGEISMRSRECHIWCLFLVLHLLPCLFPITLSDMCAMSVTVPLPWPQSPCPCVMCDLLLTCPICTHTPMQLAINTIIYGPVNIVT